MTDAERLERLLILAIMRGDRTAELVIRARIEGLAKAPTREQRHAA